MATASELTNLTVLRAADLLRRRKVSPVELTQACLERISDQSALNAFITVMADSALAEARAAEHEISGGDWRGPLHGVPVAVKDLIDVAGVPTTAASALFANRVAQRDATVVRKLREAGAVIIGKSNLHEFAYGASSVVGHWGPVRNPHDPARIAGGSSSGSAAAVATGMGLAAIGTDTAGSIRLPSAYCGVVGLKPTYGRVSAAGLVPLAWSYDHVGPMTRTVGDAAVLLNAISGYDAQDLASRAFASTVRRESDRRQLSALRVGVALKFFTDDLDPVIATAFEHTIRELHGSVQEIREITLPVNTDRTVQAAEAWAYHAEHVERDSQKYQPETLRRLRSAATITAAEYIERHREMQRLRREVEFVFEDVDVIVTPTTPVMPAMINELVAAPDELRGRELVMLRNTRPFNVLGIPAISVPCGRANEMPIGVQIAAAAGRDDLALAAAATVERLTS